MIKGSIITLQPATQNDKQIIYEWLVQWNDLALNYHKPSWEEFSHDYQDFFFDDTHENVGRCYLIIVDTNPVGHINYHKVYPDYTHIELDIWMKDKESCGRGYGSDAIKTLCDYLFQKFGIKEFIMRPSSQNQRAISAYQKAGFQYIECSLEEQVLKYTAPDSEDCIVMVKHIKI